jgi:hypothetical protein
VPSPTTRPHRELNLDHDEAERLSASEGSPEGRTIVNPGHVHGTTHLHWQLFSSAAGTATGSGNQGESGHLVPSVRARAVCVTVHLYAMKQIVAVGTGRAAGPGAGGNSGPEQWPGTLTAATGSENSESLPPAAALLAS